ncbi:MAG: hypothetical protein FJX67_03455 [Alphaproteobacteria bacterium]|nr:hypothetical protein [Alphaproteobacteria bacterium]
MRAGLAALCLLAALAPIASARAEEVVLKAVVASPPTPGLAGPYARAYLGWIDRVNATLRGKLKIKLLQGPEVPLPNKAAAALSRGTIDVLHSPTRYYNASVPEGEALSGCDLPLSEVRRNGTFDLLNQIWHDKLNAHVLGWFEFGVSYAVYTTRRPAMSDGRLQLAGLSLRSTSTLRDFVSALGARPVAINADEIAAALDRGQIQGLSFQTVALASVVPLTAVRYRIEPTVLRGANLLLINLDTWNGLTPALREALQRLAREGEEESIRVIADEATRERAALIGAGVEIVALEGAAARDYVGRASEAVWARVADRSPDHVQALRLQLAGR